MDLIQQPPASAIRYGPQYIAQGIDLIDAAVGVQGIQTYSPGFYSAAGTTQPNLGADGSSVGYWYRVMDVVFAWGLISWAGTGLAVGNSTRYLFNLPIPAINLNPRAGVSEPFPVIGSAHCRDNSSAANSQQGIVERNDADPIQCNFTSQGGNSSRTWGNAVPFTWAASDNISWNVCYVGDF